MLAGISLSLLGLTTFIFLTSDNHDDFAKCLNEKGLKLYGASWCPHCQEQKQMFESKEVIYDQIYNSLEGTFAYLCNANTHKWREKIAQKLETFYSKEISTKEINRILKHFTNSKSLEMEVCMQK